MLDYRADGRVTMSRCGLVEQACTRLLVCVAAGGMCDVWTQQCWCVCRAAGVCGVLCG